MCSCPDNEFVLHAYDFVSRKQQSKRALVTAAVPVNPPTGTGDHDYSPPTRAESFAPLSYAQLALSAAYMEQCARNRRVHKEMPPQPKQLDPLGKKFVNTIRYTAAAAQHTEEHCMRERTKIFGFLTNFGKPTWWVTFTPDDYGSLEAFVYAQGDRPSDFKTRPMRIKVMSNAPVAAALRYERCKQVFIEYLIGWDQKNCCAHKDPKRGLWGVPKAFALVTEEQGRKTLHSHGQIWIAGHSHMLWKVRNSTDAARRGI